MTEPALRELDEAPPAAFINGDATHQPKVTRAPKAEVRRRPPRNRPDESRSEDGSIMMAWPEGLATALRLHEAWRDGIAAIAQEQLALMTDIGRELVETGRAVAEETDPTRRVELVWSHALRQLDRSLDSSAKLVEAFSSPGRNMLDILTGSAADRHQTP
jgi:hypothetical protein